MKKIILFFILLPFYSYAAAPSTTCPTGFVTISEDFMIIENSSCPSGYTNVGTATSCLVSNPAGSCMMYAPANTSYTDSYGTYEFVEACPLTL